ncbi:hypothetical protein I309_03446 [Cryptococcus deuterogattii LA55]|nr:hypothetical protein I309_03446 [Cryptococcus deuterogattii LA55]
MLRVLYPEQTERFVLGTPGKYMYSDPGVYVFTNDKSQKELGITYRPKQQALKDAFDRSLLWRCKG